MNIRRALLLLSLLALPLVALAQNYPNRYIRLVVPYPAGGVADTMARPLANKLADILGQPIVVDNRPGGNTIIGSALVAKAPADGYTIGITSLTHYMMPFFFKDVPFDTMKDFTPIAEIAVIANMLAINPALPIHSVKELIEYAKKNPGKLMYGTPGIGGQQQLAGMLLAQAAGIELVHVPYKGGNQAITDCIGGQLPMLMLGSPNLLPQVRAGKLRALAVTESRRSPNSPEVPTVGETIPGYAIPPVWFGLLGPAGMPKAVVDRLSVALRQALASPEIKRNLEGRGFEMIENPPSPEAFVNEIKVDTEAIRKIVTAAGVKPE